MQELKPAHPVPAPRSFSSPEKSKPVGKVSVSLGRVVMWRVNPHLNILVVGKVSVSLDRCVVEDESAFEHLGSRQDTHHLKSVRVYMLPCR